MDAVRRRRSADYQDMLAVEITYRMPFVRIKCLETSPGTHILQFTADSRPHAKTQMKKGVSFTTGVDMHKDGDTNIQRYQQRE